LTAEILPTVPPKLYFYSSSQLIRPISQRLRFSEHEFPHSKSTIHDASLVRNVSSPVPALFATCSAAEAPPDEWCFICQRGFGEIDIPDESPCHAVTLGTRGHSMVSKCTLILLWLNISRQRPFCRGPTWPYICPDWLVRASSTIWSLALGR
jgi:hypothetical protein